MAVRRLAEGAWELRGDTTWLQLVVQEALRLEPRAEASAVRPRIMEELVQVRCPPELLARAIRAAEARVRAWRLSGGLVRLRESSFCEANALRRALMTRVPACVVDEVRILENSTGTPDDVVAENLGMVALLACEGEVSLRAQGIPTAADLRGCSVAPGWEGTVLAAEGRLELTGRVRRGCAREHAKFAAVANPAVRERLLFRSLPQAGREALAAGGLVPRRAHRGWELPRCSDLARVQELLGDLPHELSPCTDFEVTVETLGGCSAEEALEAARAALLREMAELAESAAPAG